MMVNQYNKIYKKIIFKESNSDLLSYIALGFFDGIHLGHQFLLTLCIKDAKKNNAVSTVVLFDPHPDKVIHNLNNYYLLTPINERIKKIRELGIQQVIIIDFNKDFQKITAENFITKILLQELNMGAVFVGKNYRFGFLKKGNTELIKKMSKIYNFKANIVNPLTINSQYKISSTTIKRYIREGNIEKANKLLGYHYKITGKVVHGDNRGSIVLSFPTANIVTVKDKLLPGNGVFVSLADVNGKVYKGITNIGFKPTFGQDNKRISIEIYLFNFNLNIYNDMISIRLLKRIRDEKLFSSTKELALQIKKDKMFADVFFDNNKSLI